nr:GGDEF domain-containing protein [uncultured Actinotalea sp.]
MAGTWSFVVRPSRTVEVRVLARACLVAGLVAWFTALAPFSPTAPRGLAVGFGALGLLLGLALHRHADRVTALAVHGVLVLATGVIGGCVGASTTAAGTQVTAAAFLWVVLYSAITHSRRALAAHLGLVGVALATGLHAAAAPSPFQTWAFLMSLVGAVSLVLHGVVAEFRGLATQDGLTGALTRAAFLETAERTLRHATRTGHPVSVVVLDLDDFKVVNDTLGHAAGDAVLVKTASAWRAAAGQGDALGRLGGDEFALLLPGADPSATEAFVDRLRTTTPSAWSSGAATVAAGEGLDALLARADAALYEDKRRRTGAGAVAATG